MQKIDNNQERIKDAFPRIKASPTKAGQPLHPLRFWKIKADDYRAIYEIEPRKNK